MQNKSISLLGLLVLSLSMHYSHVSQAADRTTSYWKKYGPAVLCAAVVGYFGYQKYLASEWIKQRDEASVNAFIDSLPMQDRKQDSNAQGNSVASAELGLASGIVTRNLFSPKTSAAEITDLRVDTFAVDSEDGEDDGQGLGSTRGAMPRSLSVPSLLNVTEQKTGQKKSYPYRIFYHPHYDISLLYFEYVMNLLGIHSFDTHKYSKVFNYLKSKGLAHRGNVTVPQAISDGELLKVHTQKYLESLKSNSTISEVIFAASLPLPLPNFVLQRKLLRPMKLATGGTVDAARYAMKHGGFVVNLSGGYHHAKNENGEGFCFFADIPLAIKKVQEEKPDTKVLVVDFDAHQGNGVSTIEKTNRDVCVVDAFRESIYPRWHDRKASSSPNCRAIPFDHNAKDDQYLPAIESVLKEEIKAFNPDLIIYNAGTDILAGDPYGHLNVSAEGIIKRDGLVVNAARTAAEKKNIPVVMVLSGGYTQQSAGIIGRSLENIFNELKNTQSSDRKAHLGHD